MEPFDDRELNKMLHEWKAPEAPARLRAAVFGDPWWRSMWRASVRIPLPAALALVIVAAVVCWRWPPRVVVQTKTIEVPVVQQQIIYRDRVAPPAGWRPVAELRPRIIRSRNDEN